MKKIFAIALCVMASSASAADFSTENSRISCDVGGNIHFFVDGTLLSRSFFFAKANGLPTSQSKDKPPEALLAVDANCIPVMDSVTSKSIPGQYTIQFTYGIR